MQYFVKNSLFSPRQLKRILYKHGLFRSKSNLLFTTLCDIVQVSYVFCGFSFSTQSVDFRNYSYKEVDNKTQNYMQSNKTMLKFQRLLSFPLQIQLKQFLLLIVTYITKYFKFFTKIYQCFALFTERSRGQRKYVRIKVNATETKDC